jgi:hypothetical protein
MKKAFLTLGISVFLLLSLSVTTRSDVAVGEAGLTADPGDAAPQICVLHRNVTIGTDANPPGINPLDWRTSLYAFTGEQIEYTIITRDANGALDIGNAYILVDQNPKLICEQISEPMFCFTGPDGNPICLPIPCDGLGFFNPDTDRAFLCRYTVEPTYGDHQIKIGVENSQGVATAAAHTENWFFNPKLAISITTSDNASIRFEPGNPGEYVRSINKIIVKNLAEGGMNLWIFTASTDFTDHTGTARCPITNKIDVEGLGDDTGLWYRGISGTVTGEWTHITNPDQNKGCAVDECYNAKPAPFLLPFDPKNHLLTNQGTVEIEFRLLYPMPCIGTFDEGIIYIFAKAV